MAHRLLTKDELAELPKNWAPADASAPFWAWEVDEETYLEAPPSAPILRQSIDGKYYIGV